MELPEGLKRALAGALARGGIGAIVGAGKERRNKLQPKFNLRDLQAAADTYIQTRTVAVGQLVGWRDNLVDDGYHDQPPLVGIVVDMPPRPDTSIDDWMCSVILNGADDKPYVGEFRVMRLMEITPFEASERLDEWVANQGKQQRAAIPKLMERNLDKEIPLEDVTFDSPEMVSRGFQRGDFIIHSHPEIDVTEIAVFGGIAEDGDPKTLTYEKSGRIVVENPGWCCWRKMTDDELVEWGGNRRMVDSYKLGLTVAPATNAH